MARKPVALRVIANLASNTFDKGATFPLACGGKHPGQGTGVSTHKAAEMSRTRKLELVPMSRLQSRSMIWNEMKNEDKLKNIEAVKGVRFSRSASFSNVSSPQTGWSTIRPGTWQPHAQMPPTKALIITLANARAADHE